MKRTILSCVVLMVALMAQAQTKIAPKLQNGFKAVYTEESTINMGTGKDIKVTKEAEYAVSNVTAKGAVITTTVLKVDSDVDPTDATGQLLTMTQSMLKDVPVKLITDANGQVTAIQNLAQVKAKTTELAKIMADELLKAVPAMGQMMSKESLLQQLNDAVSEEALVESFKEDGVLALNGKTITNGATDVYEKEGMKMKRMYFAAGKNIIINATLNMTKDELKAAIIKQIEKEMPEQAEMIKKNIDLVMGQLKMDMSQKSTYVLDDNGWVKSLKTETNEDIMGQKMKQTSVVTLK